MKRKAAIAILFLALFAFLAGLGIAPTDPGPKVMFKVAAKETRQSICGRLAEAGVVRNGIVFRIYSQFAGHFAPRPGVYELHGGMTPSGVVAAMAKPVEVSLYLPPNFWIKRTAKLLQSNGLAQASDYESAANDGEKFQVGLSVPLPKGSLEGYLFPDKYTFPPDATGVDIVKTQLSTFEKKAWKTLQGKDDVLRILTIASMVELEAKLEEDRPLIAGVIENRLRKGMPLQIDATVNYGMGVWKPLAVSELKSPSPYNTYLHKGLPPGPICSPSLESIEAAANPAVHTFVYYVAMPDGKHLFASDYKSHLANIAKRKTALGKKQ